MFRAQVDLIGTMGEILIFYPLGIANTTRAFVKLLPNSSYTLTAFVPNADPCKHPSTLCHLWLSLGLTKMAPHMVPHTPITFWTGSAGVHTLLNGTSRTSPLHPQHLFPVWISSAIWPGNGTGQSGGIGDGFIHCIYYIVPNILVVSHSYM